MRKIDRIIRSISIKYYRSINSQRLTDLREINVITGGNDIGKSNVIRALKLFFHGTNERDLPISFYEEFSHSRLNAVRKDSIKGKQFIQIELEFNCAGAFEKTLPDRFKVRKTWSKDPLSPPRVDNDLDKAIKAGKLDTTLAKAEGSLQRFLGSIIFTHVPAIKERSFFSTIIDQLQSVLVDQKSDSSSDFDGELEKFNAELQKTALELRKEFEDRTGISAKIALPTDYRELFRAFKISTEGDYGDQVSLDSRGDGIRVRFLPAILNYIAERSNKQHIWGFEEPENSMEYSRAFELSEAMSAIYSKNAQIFITTHSPAFINIEDEKQAVFLASRVGADTALRRLTKANIEDIKSEDPDILIANELGHIQLMDGLRKKLEERIRLTEELQAAAEMKISEIAAIEKPVVLTEGRNDVLILKEAWKRLRSSECPFEIRSCSVVDAEDGEAGGADQLASCLRSIMPSHPHIAVGLFDRDEQGLKAWKLDQNFFQDDLLSDVKSSKNGKAHAVLLPVPGHEPNFKLSQTLCMELMFPEAAVRKSVNGKSLVLTPVPIVERLGAVELGKKDGTEFWQMRVSGNKTHFAEKVVPSLDDSDFAEFEPVFAAIESVVAKTQQ
jgi:predicted ATPase